MKQVIIGLIVVGLVAVVGYGMFFISSLRSISTEISDTQAPQQEVVVSQEDTAQIPVEEPAQQVEADPQPQEPVVAETHSVPPPAAQNVAEEMPPQEETAAVDEGGMAEEMDDDDPAKRHIKEVQYLQKALPGNMMVPAEKSEQEVNQLFADAEEQNAIEQKLANDMATAEEKERYYNLRARQLDDEAELINYCNDVLASSDDDIPYELCSDVAQGSYERLQEIENTRAKLRKELLM